MTRADLDIHLDANDPDDRKAKVLCEVLAIALYPDSVSLPDGTGLTGIRQHAEDIARHACERAHREGHLTHAHILEEEVAEALNERDPANLRVELVQVAAMAVKWILDLDRKAATP
jgi:hypothetical protein